MAKKKRPEKRPASPESSKRSSLAHETLAKYVAEAKRKGVVTRETGPAKDRITVYLPLEVGEALRVHAARNRQELSQVVANALRVYLQTPEHHEGK